MKAIDANDHQPDGNVEWARLPVAQHPDRGLQIVGVVMAGAVAQAPGRITKTRSQMVFHPDQVTGQVKPVDEKVRDENGGQDQLGLCNQQERQRVEQAMDGANQRVFGFVERDVVTLQPVVSDKMAEELVHIIRSFSRHPWRWFWANNPPTRTATKNARCRAGHRAKSSGPTPGAKSSPASLGSGR